MLFYIVFSCVILFLSSLLSFYFTLSLYWNFVPPPNVKCRWSNVALCVHMHTFNVYINRGVTLILDVVVGAAAVASIEAYKCSFIFIAHLFNCVLWNCLNTARVRIQIVKKIPIHSFVISKKCFCLLEQNITKMTICSHES